MKYCPNCGKEVKGETNFCPNCGGALKEEAKPVNKGNRPHIEKREIVTCILLSIVTCGIYGIIWFINMVDDVNRVCNDEKSNQSGGTVFLLTLVTCGIYGFIWFYQAGERMYVAGQKYGMPISDNGTLYLLLMIFGLGIVNYCLLQSDLNKFSNQ